MNKVSGKNYNTFYKIHSSSQCSDIWIVPPVHLQQETILTIVHNNQHKTSHSLSLAE